jgi:DNA-binding NarL/FixJ family response regulator
MNGTPVTADGMFDALAPGDVLITTPNDCSAVECHYLSQLGMRVIVLAPVIREFDRARYIEAGAVAYIPMLLDMADLVAAINNALDEQPPQLPMVPIRPTCHANPM